MEKVHQWGNLVNQEIAITKIQFDVNEIIKKGEQQIFDIANQKHKNGNTYRNSKVTWIKKWPELTQNIDKSISRFQKTWGFDLKTFEKIKEWPRSWPGGAPRRAWKLDLRVAI